MKVLRDIKHMQVENIKIEHMHFLLKGFALATDYEFMRDLDSDSREAIRMIEEFLPKIINHTALELSRCNLGDVRMI